jgi:hypothetical protein
MTQQTTSNEKATSDKQLAAVQSFVQKLGSLEKAKQAIEELTRLRKTA